MASVSFFLFYGEFVAGFVKLFVLFRCWMFLRTRLRLFRACQQVLLVGSTDMTKIHPIGVVPKRGVLQSVGDQPGWRMLHCGAADFTDDWVGANTQLFADSVEQVRHSHNVYINKAQLCVAVVEKESQKTCVVSLYVIWMILNRFNHVLAIIRLKIDPSGPLQVGCSGSNLSDDFSWCHRKISLKLIETLNIKLRKQIVLMSWIFPYISGIFKSFFYDFAAWHMNPLLEAWPRQPVGILRHPCWSYVATLESWWIMSNINYKLYVYVYIDIHVHNSDARKRMKYF